MGWPPLAFDKDAPITREEIVDNDLMVFDAIGNYEDVNLFPTEKPLEFKRHNQLKLEKQESNGFGDIDPRISTDEHADNGPEGKWAIYKPDGWLKNTAQLDKVYTEE